jgi:uncharacterized surface protein with fasciclin (FAS1) repeats
MRMASFQNGLFLGLALLILGSAGVRGDGAAKDRDVVETAVAAGKFKTLATALEAADLIETLQGKGPFTVFAPTDEAFAKLPQGTVEALLKDKKRLTTLLTYHVAPKNVASGEIVKFETATLQSIEGSLIALKAADGTVTLNGASKVTQADIVCRNGVIHVIDAVILPPSFTGENDKAIIVAFCESSFTKDVAADAKAGSWDKAKERNKEYRGLLDRMAEMTPKLGTKESWDAQIKYLLIAEKNIEEGIANQNAFVVAQGTLQSRAQCFACHLSHKQK